MDLEKKPSSLDSSFPPTSFPPSAPLPTTPTRLPHSGLGIASLVISVVSGIAFLATAVFSGLLYNSGNDAMYDLEAIFAILGLLLFAEIGGLVLAFGLGIAGLFQQNRNKSTAIIGTILSCIGGFVLVSFMLISIIAE